MTEINSFQSSCRICTANCTDARSIFDEIHDGKRAVDLLEYCLQQPINTNGCFPMDICDLCTSCLIETYEFFVIYKKSETYFLSLLDSSGQSAIKIESIDLPMNHDTSEQPLETEYMAIEEAPESIHFDVKTEYEEDEEEDANEQIDSEPEAGDDWFSAGNVSDGSSEEHEEDEVENEAVEYEVANDSEPEHAKESKKTVPKGSSKRKVICDICGKILTGSTRLDVHKSKFDAIE